MQSAATNTNRHATATFIAEPVGRYRYACRPDVHVLPAAMPGCRIRSCLPGIFVSNESNNDKDTSTSFRLQPAGSVIGSSYRKPILLINTEPFFGTLQQKTSLPNLLLLG
jgi:hypothetical protein